MRTSNHAFYGFVRNLFNGSVINGDDIRSCDCVVVRKGEIFVLVEDNIPEFCLERLRKTTKKIRKVGVEAEIPTAHLLKRS
jgi:hypothetical protein